MTQDVYVCCMYIRVLCVYMYVLAPPFTHTHSFICVTYVYVSLSACVSECV